jgi:hypothetical protein
VSARMNPATASGVSAPSVKKPNPASRFAVSGSEDLVHLAVHAPRSRAGVLAGRRS